MALGAFFVACAGQVEAWTYSELIELVKSNDVEGTCKLLKQGTGDVNVNSVWDMYGAPLLYIACENNSFEMAKLLIGAGANVNLATGRCATPLHAACEHNDSLKLVKLLVEQGAKVRAQNYNLAEPLNKAIWAFLKESTEKSTTTKKNMDVIKFLLERGANINVPRRSCSVFSPLHHACHEKNLELALFLIEHGANGFKRKDPEEKRPFDRLNEKQRATLLQSLVHFKKGQEESDSALFISLVLASLANQVKNGMVLPLLPQNSQHRTTDIKNRNALIELAEKTMAFYFGPRKKIVFPNWIPHDGLSEKAHELGKLLLSKTLQDLIIKRDYKGMSERKFFFFTILDRYARALCVDHLKKFPACAYVKVLTCDDRKKLALYIKFKDITIRFDKSAFKQKNKKSVIIEDVTKEFDQKK